MCPYSSQCEEVERQCNELNKSTYSASSETPAKREMLRLNVAYGCGKEAEKEKLVSITNRDDEKTLKKVHSGNKYIYFQQNELTQGYDIVICTPSCLIRLLETPEMMNFKRLCHLVLDDADTLFSSYNDEVVSLKKSMTK